MWNFAKGSGRQRYVTRPRYTLCAHSQKGKLEKAVSPPASYWCRNATICLERFATEKELSQHLEVAVFTSDDLKSFAKSILQGAVYRPRIHCILCNTALRWGQLDYEDDFRDGCKLQMALTPEIPHYGLSRCVAEIVSKRTVDGTCHCCKIWTRVC
jgi:hypothetical protein